MRKVLTILILIASLLGQSVLAAHSMPDIDDAVHATSHVGPAHHHEADGSTHFDDSGESLNHMQADQAGSVTAALPRAPFALAPFLRHGFARAPTPTAPPDPFLDGPRRPPRSAS